MSLKTMDKILNSEEVENSQKQKRHLIRDSTLFKPQVNATLVKSLKIIHFWCFKSRTKLSQWSDAILRSQKRLGGHTHLSENAPEDILILAFDSVGPSASHLVSWLQDLMLLGTCWLGEDIQYVSQNQKGLWWVFRVLKPKSPVGKASVCSHLGWILALLRAALVWFLHCETQLATSQGFYDERMVNCFWNSEQPCVPPCACSAAQASPSPPALSSMGREG